MNTKDEEYMITLDNCRSITHAAEKLHITQPALSIFLSRLEESLGMVLFERMGKRLIPTAAGKAYLKYARQIMTLKGDFEQETLALKKEQHGELHIGCLEKRSHFLMPLLIRRFQETHPGIYAILHTYRLKELYQLLLEGETDLIYVNQDLHLPELNSALIRSDHLLLVLPKGHPAAAFAQTMEGKSFPYLDLKYVEQETFYVLSPGHSIRFMVDDAIQYSHVHPRHLHIIPTIDLGCQMASEGLGVSFTTESYSRSLNYPAPRQYFLTGNLSNKTNWKVFWRKSTVISQYMREFIELLREMEQETFD